MHFKARLNSGSFRTADDGDSYIFPVVISDSTVDSYYTHMDTTSLTNYAQAAKEGVMLLDSHNRKRLGYGRSIDGILVRKNGDMEVRAIFEIPVGISFGGDMTYATTDDCIRAIETGIIQDVSIGFSAEDEDYICDICGHQYFDKTQCSHVAGVSYETEDGESVRATVGIRNASLMEVSLVYKGANENAKLLRKARETLHDLPPKEQLAVVRTYPELAAEVHPQDVENPENGIGQNNNGGKKMAELSDKLRAELAKRGYEGEDQATQDVAVTVIQDLQRALDEATAQLAKYESELVRLQKLADDGKAYRADLIEDTITTGIKAMGNLFPAEQYRGLLADAPLDTIKELKESFARAQVELPNGTRKTIEKTGEANNTNQPATPPAYLFRAG